MIKLAYAKQNNPDLIEENIIERCPSFYDIEIKETCNLEGKMGEIVQILSDKEIIQMCNEYYDWKHGKVLADESAIKKFWENNQEIYFSVDYLAGFIMIEAYRRFYKLIKLISTNKTITSNDSNILNLFN